MIKRIAITGGIGSGKTTVCKLFERMHVPVYYADVQAKMLMETDKELASAIEKLFGSEAYDEGRLNRAHIASLVFTNAHLLKTLNELVHPAVHIDFARWLALHQHATYVLYESALLYENDMERNFDAVICVNAPEKIRIKRVMQRDGKSEEAVKAIMRNQLPAAVKKEKADFLIENDGEQSLILQVQHVHQLILSG